MPEQKRRRQPDQTDVNQNGERIFDELKRMLEFGKGSWQDDPIHHKIDSNAVKHAADEGLSPEQRNRATREVENHHDAERHKEMLSKAEGGRNVTPVKARLAVPGKNEPLKAVDEGDSAVEPDGKG